MTIWLKYLGQGDYKAYLHKKTSFEFGNQEMYIGAIQQILEKLPVSEKQPTSGLGSGPEIEKLTMQKLRVKYIHPQSFIQIYCVVSEEKRDQP